MKPEQKPIKYIETVKKPLNHSANVIFATRPKTHSDIFLKFCNRY